VQCCERLTLPDYPAEQSTQFDIYALSGKIAE
jgi:hypothetical protein